MPRMNNVSPAPAALFRKKRLKPYRGRGEIYSWLRAHHREIAARLASGEASWTTLCGEMVRHGLTGRRGESPAPKAAPKVWQRVCRDLEEVTAAALPKQRKPPSKVSRDWRPQLALPAPQSSPGPTDLDKPYDPLERIAEIRREVKARSGQKE
jgi:hypothetical protein